MINSNVLSNKSMSGKVSVKGTGRIARFREEETYTLAAAVAKIFIAKGFVVSADEILHTPKPVDKEKVTQAKAKVKPKKTTTKKK